MLGDRKKLLSLALIVAGATLLSLGAREYIGSIWTQREAAKRWEDSSRTAATKAGTKQAVPDLGPAFARLSIPRLESSWFVFPGVGKEELRLGPGHMPGSALPGMRGNVIIAGHRDTHFRVLKDVHEGDELLVETRQGRFRYKVAKISIVKPTNTKALQDTAEPVMNLITCYPFYYLGSAPMRYIVEAHLAGDSGIVDARARKQVH
ncbi:MAG TPA: class D sortase [Bryobacteraceae bacterium]|nr:class D sortase [Bryobacteraceae bacterium]